MRTTGSAQLDFLEEDAALEPRERSASDLRLEVAQRLQSHRQRRARLTPEPTPEAPARSASPKDRIAAAVAERYAQTPSYRAVLAEEARIATERAAAEAESAAAKHESAAAKHEIARRNAEAIAAQQQQLLTELELWDAPQQFTPETAQVVVSESPAPDVSVPHPFHASVGWVGPQIPVATQALTVRLYEDLGPIPTLPERPHSNAGFDAAEAHALDEEIAFRQAPVFQHYSTEPPVPIAANLLEFPRQLIAARKARPVLAEGPLLEEAAARTRQLRIFEVEPELISPAPPPVTNAPEWSSIRLDAHTVTAPVLSPETPLLPSLLPLRPASLELRAMAALVDFLLVTGAFVIFIGILAKVVGYIPTGIPAAVAAGLTFAIFHGLYQLLFFTLTDQTPGMAYARLSLCTFADDNPTRKAMRKRILAQALAAAPLGLGLLWALLDEDNLGWHDRLSRMYQRAY